MSHITRGHPFSRILLAISLLAFGMSVSVPAYASGGQSLFVWSNAIDDLGANKDLPLLGATPPEPHTSTTGGTNYNITFPYAGTFSSLSFYSADDLGAGNGSGSNSIFTKINGSAGNLSATIVGLGVALDATNTDQIATSTDVRYGSAKTGTQTLASWVKVLFQAAGDHVSAYFSNRIPAGITYDQTAIRYLEFAGDGRTDGEATEASVALKARAGGVLENFSIHVVANAATSSNRIIRVRKNSANGNGLITIPAGGTGWFYDATSTDTIASGDTFNAKIEPLTASDDIKIDQIGIWMRNPSARESDLFISPGLQSGASGVARPASTTPSYASIGGSGSSALSAFSGDLTTRKFAPGFAGTARNLRVRLSANTYTATSTLKLKNSTQSTEISLSLPPKGGGAANYENTTDDLDFSATDELVYELLGGTSGSMTVQWIGSTLLDTTP